MRVDLDEGSSLELLPRFQQALFQGRRLFRLAMGLGGLVLLLVLWALFAWLFARNSIGLVLLLNNAAALLLLAAAVQSAYWLTVWRAKALLAAPQETPSNIPLAHDSSGYDRLLDWLGQSIAHRAAQLGAPALWLAGLSVLVLLGVRAAWRWDLPALDAATSTAAHVVGAGALALAFALLVLERHLAHEHPQPWPEAQGLARLSRIPIIVLVTTALCLFFASAGTVWPLRLAVVIGLLPALAAAEFVLRALLSLFSPHQPRLEPRWMADSLVAGSLRWPPRPLQALQQELHNRFGLDLRQIWAFGYMRRAFLPVLAVVVLIGWALSGIYQVPLAGRGIYERFGEPVAVLGPGLHAGLPWPFGRVQAVENGVVHELAASLGTEGETPAPTDTAESPAPASANRLWDASHVLDKSQVIASGAGTQQSFQVVSMDVRFVYRIGLSDSAALAATYNSADVPALLRSTASRILVQDFANRTLDDLLGAQRTQLADSIGKQLQADLDQLNSGVELLATVVEAIHPPAGAANAYHGVQAAQIAVQALIARERGAASERANEAQLNASVRHDQATATAQEVNATAQAANVRFAAERQAYASAGQAFVLEQYLSQLQRGLANAHVLIVDHRLGGESAPTLDLRTFAPGVVDPPARKTKP